MKRLLVANRGEVASRVIRGAAECGITPIAMFSADDAAAPFRFMAEAIPLPGTGPAAYLDIAAIIAAARAARADALHPGWGFLSVSPARARACAEAGIIFVGPPAELLALFGDKLRARELAVSSGVPVAETAATLRDAGALLAGGPVMVKAAAGGGGRGMRLARDAITLEAAWENCAAEAQAAFGDGTVYAERYIAQARHVEIQIAGDGTDSLALGSRECSLQRRHQKLVEFAPAGVPVVEALAQAALRMARGANYAGLGTWEFLVAGPKFWFLEVNPRLQVEHTVTEAVTGLDLVHLQLHLAAGGTLAALNLPSPMPVNGVAMQLRINAERMDRHGDVWPSAGTITRLAPPAGPGIRVDHALGVGYAPSPAFDSLLAKLIIHAPARDVLFRRAARALHDFEIAGLGTNLALLTRLIGMEAVVSDEIDTGFIERHAASLGDAAPDPDSFGDAVPDGLIAIAAPMTGQLVSLSVAVGDEIHPGQTAGLVEAMKMQVALSPAAPGRVNAVLVEPGATVQQGETILLIEPISGAGGVDEQAAHDPEAIRPDLAELLQRRRAITDEARPAAIARRHQQGKRSIRENLAALLDPESFIEYGALGVAAQRRRRSLDELIRLTPADGLISGIGKVDGQDVTVLAYDYTVLAGTQGFIGHKKTDRLLALALANRLPLVLFAEGGGGRPGDTDWIGVAGLDLPTFGRFARLSGQVPVLGIVAGNCFAGNAALLGCCDTIIATQDASIGMGGPAMIEGGGLGVFKPEEVGPMSVQVPNGVVDIAVADEAEAVRVARQYLSYFQGALADWSCADQRLLRRLIPENRLRVYDVREVLATMADTGSVLEIRRGFGLGMITAFARVEGRPVGVIANNPMHLGGAIDSDAADKAARFMQLCDAFDIPIVTLCDTPGNMVGPEYEKTGLVRHCCRMFVIGANITVPLITIVLRKAYGLGAQGMAGAGFHAPLIAVSWPTGEFGGMGLEGAVKLGYRNELAAITDPEERRATYDRMVAEMYEKGKALSTASLFELDDVIDPADTRRIIAESLRAVPPAPARTGKKHAWIDTW